MIRILIAEDQALVRSALATLLGYEDDFEVIAEAADGIEAVELAERLLPDIALVDIEMPKQSGLDVVKILQTQVPTCKSIIVTTFARPGYLHRAVQAGAFGYLLKDTHVDELSQSIRRIYDGGKIISAELMFSAWTFQNPLTDREIEILQNAASGCTTREIARNLCLSEGTVRNYLSEAISKLEVTSRHEAIKVAEAQGWL